MDAMWALCGGCAVGGVSSTSRRAWLFQRCSAWVVVRAADGRCSCASSFLAICEKGNAVTNSGWLEKLVQRAGIRTFRRCETDVSRKQCQRSACCFVSILRSLFLHAVDRHTAMLSIASRSFV